MGCHALEAVPSGLPGVALTKTDIRGVIKIQASGHALTGHGIGLNQAGRVFALGAGKIVLHRKPRHGALDTQVIGRREFFRLLGAATVAVMRWAERGR